MWKLNTSNLGKLSEYRSFFAKHGLELNATTTDIAEIEADHLTVTVHKASQFSDEEVLVEDTSLEIENASIGINIRWLLDHLLEYEGHRAHWTVYLAYRKNDLVYVFSGVIHGTIVSPKGTEGYGFDPYFVPDGAILTLAENKEDRFNARFHAVEALFANQPFAVRPAIDNWTGPWQ